MHLYVNCAYIFNDGMKLAQINAMCPHCVIWLLMQYIICSDFRFSDTPFPTVLHKVILRRHWYY